jgi:hypothetical protein
MTKASPAACVAGGSVGVTPLIGWISATVRFTLLPAYVPTMASEYGDVAMHPPETAPPGPPSDIVNKAFMSPSLFS